jgi:hypothetical protein
VAEQTDGDDDIALQRQPLLDLIKRTFEPGAPAQRDHRIFSNHSNPLSGQALQRLRAADTVKS